MVNMTNDAWFGKTSGPLQHLAMYPLRAVEDRVAIARAANTGVSAFVAPSGRIVRVAPLFEAAVLADRIASDADDPVHAARRLVGLGVRRGGGGALRVGLARPDRHAE